MEFSSIKLINIVKKNDFQLLAELSKDGVSLNVFRKSDQESILDIALYEKSNESFFIIIKQLLLHESTKEKTFEHITKMRKDSNKSILQEIIDNNMVDVFSFIIDTCPNLVNASLPCYRLASYPKTETNMLLSVIVAESGNESMMEKLIDSNVELNVSDGLFGVPANWYASTPAMAALMNSGISKESSVISSSALMEFVFNNAFYSQKKESKKEILSDFNKMYEYYKKTSPLELEKSQDRSGSDAFFFELEGTSMADGEMSVASNMNDQNTRNRSVPVNIEVWHSAFVNMIHDNMDIHDDGLVLRTISDYSIVKNIKDSDVYAFDILRELAKRKCEIIPVRDVSVYELSNTFINLSRILKSHPDKKEQKIVINSFLIPLLDHIKDRGLKEQFDINIMYNHGQSTLLDVSIKNGSIEFIDVIVKEMHDDNIDGLISTKCIENLIIDKNSVVLSNILERLNQEEIDSILSSKKISDQVFDVLNKFNRHQGDEEIKIMNIFLKFITDNESFFYYDENESSNFRVDMRSRLVDFMLNNRYPEYEESGMPVIFDSLLDVSNEEMFYTHYKDRHYSFGADYLFNPFSLSASFYQSKMLEQLINKFGTEGLCRADQKGLVALDYAILNGQKENVDLIIDSLGLEQTKELIKNSKFDLMMRAVSSNDDMLNWFLGKYEKKLELNIEDVSAGNRFPHVYAKYINESNLSIKSEYFVSLQSFDLNFNILNSEGLSPLHILNQGIFNLDNKSLKMFDSIESMISKNSVNTYKDFISKGADPNLLSSNGDHFLTPLVDLMTSLSNDRDLYFSKTFVEDIHVFIDEFLCIDSYGINASKVMSSDGRFSLYDAFVYMGCMDHIGIVGTSYLMLLPEDLLEENNISENFHELNNVIRDLASVLKRKYSNKFKSSNDPYSTDHLYFNTFIDSLDKQSYSVKDAMFCLEKISHCTTLEKKHIKSIVDRIFEQYPDIGNKTFGLTGSPLSFAIKAGNSFLVNYYVKEKHVNFNDIISINGICTTPIRTALKLMDKNGLETMMPIIQTLASSGAEIDSKIVMEQLSINDSQDIFYILNYCSDAIPVYAASKVLFENNKNIKKPILNIHPRL